VKTYDKSAPSKTVYRDWFQLKVMFTTNNGQINQKSSKINNCKLYWKKNPAQTLIELPQQFKVDNQPFHDVYKPWKRSRKKGDGYT